MTEDRNPEQGEDRQYEAPEVEPIGSAEKLAKGNEGSQTDDVLDN
jgi:hypothetical protein